MLCLLSRSARPDSAISLKTMSLPANYPICMHQNKGVTAVPTGYGTSPLNIANATRVVKTTVCGTLPKPKKLIPLAASALVEPGNGKFRRYLRGLAELQNSPRGLDSRFLSQNQHPCHP